MTETAGRVRVASAEQIGLSAREAASVPPRDAASWAKKVDRLEVDPREGVRGTNVAGRRLTGPVQGFGKMWQKTYRMDVGQNSGKCSRQVAMACSGVTSGPASIR